MAALKIRRTVTRGAGGSVLATGRGRRKSAEDLRHGYADLTDQLLLGTLTAKGKTRLETVTRTLDRLDAGAAERVAARDASFVDERGTVARRLAELRNNFRERSLAPCG